MTAATVTATEVREISIDLLQVSDSETRKTVDEAALKELAQSIKADGVQEPLLVRPYGTPNGHKLAKQHYEIVAGQRRFLASQLANKPTCPCIVREMSDAQARQAAIVSNLQREDLPPLEEAQGFAQLLLGSEVEAVAAKLGKSASYVTRRLKLLDAIKPVQEALKAGAIEVGHALEIARMADEQQGALLESLNIGFELLDGDKDGDVEFDNPEPGECRFCECTEDAACRLDGGRNCSWADERKTVCDNPGCLAQWKFEGGTSDGKWEKTTVSVATLKRRIADYSLKNLSAAPFLLDDEGLGEMACTRCPKRTMNAALLFNDLAGSDTCTDSGCFVRKCGAFVQIEIKLAAKAKRPLLKLSDGYTNEKDVLRKYNITVIADDGNKPCDREEEAIWIDGRKLGKVVQICRKSDCKIHGSSGISRSKSSPDASAERKKILAKVKTMKAYRGALMKALAMAPIPQPSWNDLNLEVCVQLIHHANSQQVGKLAIALGWPDKLFRYDQKKALREQLVMMQPPERLRVALLAEHCGEMGVQEYNLQAKPEDLERLAKLFGVDVKNLEDGRVEAPKSPAKPAAAPKKQPVKKAAKQAKKSVLSAAAKKRIGEAQRKRWAGMKKAGRK